MLLWRGWPCSRGSAWLWQCSHQECTAGHRQVGVLLLWGRKPSLIGSVLAPLPLRGTVLLRCCSEKQGNKREKGEKEGVGFSVFVSFVCLNECVCVFPLRGGSERNATVPLRMSTPLKQPQGLLKTDTHPWYTHTHTLRGFGMEGSIKLHRLNTYQDQGAKLPIKIPDFHCLTSALRKIIGSQ